MTLDRTTTSPKAVLLDWDNTLVSSWDIIHDAMNVTLTRFGHEPWSLADIRGRVRKSMRDSFPELFGDAWEEAREVFFDRFREIHVDRLTLLPGAEEMIRRLADSDLHLAIVSNKTGDFLRAEIAHLGWTNLFDGIVGATDASRDKPAIEPVRLALGDSGIEPGPAVWFAGDADIDLQCAHGAGATAVLIRPEPPVSGEFGDTPPHHHVADCHAFLQLIEINRR
ncbi:MAG: HAD family hydrolase [Rhodospirillales bacterium]